MVRVSRDLKLNFERKCQMKGDVPSEIIRMMIRDYVRKPKS